MKYNFSKQERILNLREIWPHEAHHFTHWVVDEGLDLLSKELNLNEIIDAKREEKVGNKTADIVAIEAKTGRKIIIENQLEVTNHDHLGKIVTYASGKEGDIVIWIVKEATKEYTKAVEWLNRRTDDNIDFYLVEIQVWKINDNLLIPRFKVVVHPSPKEKYRELSESDKFFINFWGGFNEYADIFPYHFFDSSENFYAMRKPHPEGNYDLYVYGYSQVRVALILLKTKKMVKAGIYIPNDKKVFAQLINHKEDISKEFNSELEWNEGQRKASSVYLIKEFNDFENEESQHEIFKWLCDTALIWKEIVKRYC